MSRGGETVEYSRSDNLRDFSVYLKRNNDPTFTKLKDKILRNLLVTLGSTTCNSQIFYFLENAVVLLCIIYQIKKNSLFD